MNPAEVAKRLIIGRRLRSTQLGETLLPKRIALPVFASDALSSVAYAPDEILLTLSLAGLVAYGYSWKIAILVAVVMLVVVASYRQNVHAYPSGGGDYEVATTNLGSNAGLTVASALMVDYVLTVAVSISSGVQNAKSVFPFIDGHEAWIGALAALILMALNLRGVRESGAVFAIPVYCFMVGIIGMVVYGLFRILVLGDEVRAHSAQYGIEADPKYAAFTGFAMVALLARAFSSGSAALTGVEAISNGVPAFRKPKSKNAATTLLLLGTIAVTMLIGVITLANLTGLKLIDAPYSHYTLNGQRVDVVEETAIGQLSRAIFVELLPGLLLRGRRHHADPVPGREHRLQRLPGAGLDPGPGRLPAPPAAHPRRSAGVQQRHHHPGRAGDHPDHRVPRRRDRAHPAVRGRGLRLLHGEPAGHAAALDPAAEDREEAGGPGADEAVADHQRRPA